MIVYRFDNAYGEATSGEVYGLPLVITAHLEKVRNGRDDFRLDLDCSGWLRTILNSEWLRTDESSGWLREVQIGFYNSDWHRTIQIGFDCPGWD